MVGGRRGRQSVAGGFTASLLFLALFLALALAACGRGKQEVRQVGGLLGVEPSAVDFGDIALGKEMRQTLTLRNDGLVEMNVDQLPGFQGGPQLDFEVVGLPLVLRSGESLQVEVRYHPQQTGSQHALVGLQTDSPVQDALSVALQGHSVLGLAQLSADTLDFGDVVVGESATLSFTLLNNDGHAATEIAIAPVQGPGKGAFTPAQSGKVPLASEQLLTVPCLFAPPALGTFGALVHVTPCPTCQPRTVALLGSGVDRLLSVKPSSIDFGNVQLGQKASAPVLISNLSLGKVTLRSASISGSSDVTLGLASGGSAPIELGPGQTLTALFTFAPTRLGAQSAAATLTASDGAPGLVSLIGLGVGPVLSARPTSFYVGPALVGTTRTARISLTNVGLDPAQTAPLNVTRAWLRTSDGAAWVITSAPRFAVGEPGSSADVELAFTPRTATLSTATLVLESNDGLHPSVEVDLAGLGRVLAPCNARLLPAGTVEFGRTQLQHPTTQGFEIINDGPDDCILGDPSLTAGGPAFHWPGAVIPGGRTLPPAGRMSVRLEFTPDQAQTYSGAVEMYVSNKAAPMLHVELRGEGDGSCFFLTPGAIDFGQAQSGCAATVRTAYAVNQCASPVSVESATIPAGPFAVGALQALPAIVQPQTSLEIPIQYQPGSAGDDVAALSVTASTGGSAYQIGLTGGSVSGKYVSDSWSQSTPKVDLLLVIDNSGSMAEEQQALQLNLNRLWSRIALANADFHIAVTTSGVNPYDSGWTQCPGGASGGEAGRFFPVDNSRPRILTPQTPDLQNSLYANINVGLCHWDERLIEPAIDALTAPLINESKVPGTPLPADGNAGFLRDDARLSVLVVSDTDDDNDVPSPPSVESMAAQLYAVKKGVKEMVSFTAIVPLQNCATVEQFGPRNRQLVAALNGTAYDICDLKNMGDLLDRAIGDLMQPLSSFALTAVPREPGQIEVTINGAKVSGFSYDQKTNRIVFAKGSVPPPGSTVGASYAPACGG